MYVRTCVCVCACVRACVRVCVCVRALFTTIFLQYQNFNITLTFDIFTCLSLIGQNYFLGTQKKSIKSLGN